MFSQLRDAFSTWAHSPTSLLSLGAGVRLALAAILMVALALAAWWAMLE
ncbi:hypothetical protein [Pseudacidovorax intermedius]|nr:hypothetical protein [Pseudacidovorax intermedius]